MVTLLGMTLAAAACSTPAMIEPGKVKTVIDFVNASAGVPVTLMIYADDYDCSGKAYLAFFQPVSTVSSETFRPRPFQTVTYQYHSAKLTAQGIAGSYCRGTHTFKAADAKHFRVTTQDGRDACKIKIEKEEMQAGARRWVAVPSTAREFRTPMMESGAFCQPNPQFAGSSVYLKPHGVK